MISDPLSSTLRGLRRAAVPALLLAALTSASFAGDGPAVPASPKRVEAEAWRKSFRERARELTGVANGIKVQGRALMPEDHRRIADCERRADILQGAASTLRLALRGKTLLLSAEEREQVSAALAVLNEPEESAPSPRRGLRPLPLRPGPPKSTDGPDAGRRPTPLSPRPADPEHRARELALEVELLKRRRERLKAELTATEARLEELAAERRLLRHRAKAHPSAPAPNTPGRVIDDLMGDARFHCRRLERPSWCGLVVDTELTMARRAASRAMLFGAAGAAGYRPTGVIEIRRAVDGLNLAPKGRMILLVESLKAGEEARLPEGVGVVKGPAESRATAIFPSFQDPKPAWFVSFKQLVPLLGGVTPVELIERFEPATGAKPGRWSLEHRAARAAGAASKPGRGKRRGGSR